MASHMLPDPRQPAVQGRLAELLPHLNTEAFRQRTVIVTGGTGFFGYWLMSLFDLLNQRGFDVRVRAVSRSPARFATRASYLATRPWLTLIEADVKDIGETAPADYIIHAATDTHADAHRNPLAIMDDVLLGTRNVLTSARQTGAKRMLYVSSGAVYGPQPSHIEQLHEDDAVACNPCHPASAYGEAKRAAEQWSLQFGHQYGIVIPIARCFAFVGAGFPLDGHFAIGNFIRDALANQPIQITGNGSPLRSYLYGADLAIWLLQLLVRGEHGRAYNVGSDEVVSIAELAHTVCLTLASCQPVQLAHQEIEHTPRTRYIPSIMRARDELGLDVWTHLRDAIRLTAKCAAHTTAHLKT